MAARNCLWDIDSRKRKINRLAGTSEYLCLEVKCCLKIYVGIVSRNCKLRF